MKGYFYILLAVIAWGFEYLFIKAGTDRVSPFVSGAYLFGTATILLFLFSLSHKDLMKSILRNLYILILIGVIGTGCNMFFIFGVKNTSISNSAILGRADIVFTLLLSSLLFREKIKKSNIIIIAIMLAGVFLTVCTDLNTFRFGNRGDYFILTAALLISINAFFIKKCMKNVGGVIIALVNAFINTLCFIGSVIFFESSKAFTAVSNETLLTLIAAGICCCMFFIGYYGGLKKLPVWVVRLLCLGVPLVAICANWIWYNKTPTLWQAGGGILILGGATGIVLSSVKNAGKNNLIRDKLCGIINNRQK